MHQCQPQHKLHTTAILLTDKPHTAVSLNKNRLHTQIFGPPQHEIFEETQYGMIRKMQKDFYSSASTFRQIETDWKAETRTEV